MSQLEWTSEGDETTEEYTAEFDGIVEAYVAPHPDGRGYLWHADYVGEMPTFRDDEPLLPDDMAGEADSLEEAQEAAEECMKALAARVA